MKIRAFLSTFYGRWHNYQIIGTPLMCAKCWVGKHWWSRYDPGICDCCGKERRADERTKTG